MSIYVGIDPGGIKAFGWCVINVEKNENIYKLGSGTCSDSKEAVESIADTIQTPPLTAGIDAPMYWVRTNERLSDVKIRKMVSAHGGHPATVGHINSLRGACLVQGILSAITLKEKWPEIKITETHPKALLTIWPDIKNRLANIKFQTEHERDAFIGAYTAWQWNKRSLGWKNLVLNESSVFFPSGEEVAYWFPSE